MTGTITVNPTLSSSGAPRLGSVVSLALGVPFQAGRSYYMAASLGSLPGLEVAGGRIVPLNPDLLLLLSLGSSAPPFLGFAGVLDGGGLGSAQLLILPIPQLVGTTLHLAFVTIDPQGPGATGSVSNSVALTVMP